MGGVLKIAALSAVLAAGFVALTDKGAPPSAARFLTERVAAEPAPVTDACGAAAWPYVDRTCLQGGEDLAVRRIDLDRMQFSARSGLVQASAATNPIR